MSADYEYDMHDVQKLKSSYQDLLQEERKGLYLGVFGFVATFACLKRFTYFRPTSTAVSSLILGSQFYGFYTHRARTYYAEAARIVNANASKQINECLNY